MMGLIRVEPTERAQSPKIIASNPTSKELLSRRTSDN